MEGDEPYGGRWNFDSENRHAFNQDAITLIPKPLLFQNDVRAINERLEHHNVPRFGKQKDISIWPTNRAQSLSLLKSFCTQCLPLFGTYQDAMTDKSPNAWSLYHSRLSFCLNTKMLSPMQVIDAALNTYHKSDGSIALAQVEGFIRQILGWREYVRGIYWINQPNYSKKNTLKARRKLPDWFWNGETNMNCQKQAIQQSLDYSYAHHIQRLMITGNFSLLTGLDPDQVEAWYLGIYIDAIEWVEQPNTRSMALFADNGWIATKPYAASGNYVKKMSDYCVDCKYSVSKKTGDGACPLNSFYWHFLERNKGSLEKNPRLAFPYKTWQKMKPEAKHEILEQAESYLNQLESL